MNSPSATCCSAINISSQLGPQLYEDSSQPATSQLNINMSSRVLAQNSALSDHIVFEADEMVSPSGEGFVHINSALDGMNDD
jgi:hypothetical protein